MLQLLRRGLFYACYCILWRVRVSLQLAQLGEQLVVHMFLRQPKARYGMIHIPQRPFVEYNQHHLRFGIDDYNVDLRYQRGT